MFTSLLVAAVLVVASECYPAELHDVAAKAAPYKYEYSVDDKEHGTSYSHRESRDNEVTKGDYKVNLPDGRVKTVTYTVDEAGGFNAVVKYDGEVTVQAPPSSPRHSSPVSPRTLQQQPSFQPEFSQPQVAPAFSPQSDFTSLPISPAQPQQFDQRSFREPQFAPISEFQPTLISFEQPQPQQSPTFFTPAEPHVSSLNFRNPHLHF